MTRPRQATTAAMIGTLLVLAALALPVPAADEAPLARVTFQVD